MDTRFLGFEAFVANVLRSLLAVVNEHNIEEWCLLGCYAVWLL
jgi:hypothetical protein